MIVAKKFPRRHRGTALKGGRRMALASRLRGAGAIQPEFHLATDWKWMNLSLLLSGFTHQINGSIHAIDFK